MMQQPILVVGGRTTGLMMASELARRGIEVRIIDRSPGIDPHVRASLVHSRTLEIFQGLGIDEEVTEGSIAERAVNLYANGQRRGVARHEPIDSPFPFGMSQSQAHTEAVLERHLNRHGVRVERSVELTAVVQADDHVDATIRRADRSPETIRVPWLIGCDGAHSTTRHAAGCAFPGARDPYPYVLADVVVEGALELDEGYAFLHDEGDLFIFSSLPGGRRLVCASVSPDDDRDDPISLALVQSLVDRRTFGGLALSDPRWLTRFRIDYRLAPHYRHGRVFLAGDAAHIHSLISGQGMNTGIQDAFNLAWKLALVTRGVVPETWLDSYESERRQVGEEVVAMTRAATENFEAFAGLSETERTRLIDHMSVPDGQRLSAARHLQEVDLDYRKSPLSREGAGVFARGPHAGAQAPDAAPIRVDGSQTSLYRFLGGVNHRLLLFSGQESVASASELENACRAAAPCSDWIDCCVVSRDSAAGPGTSAPMTHVQDPQGIMHSRYGADAPSVYLLRPDGYVAYRGRGLEGLQEYLERACDRR